MTSFSPSLPTSPFLDVVPCLCSTLLSGTIDATLLTKGAAAAHLHASCATHTEGTRRTKLKGRKQIDKSKCHPGRKITFGRLSCQPVALPSLVLVHVSLAPAGPSQWKTICMVFCFRMHHRRRYPPLSLPRYSLLSIQSFLSHPLPLPCLHFPLVLQSVRLPFGFRYCRLRVCIPVCVRNQQWSNGQAAGDPREMRPK